MKLCSWDLELRSCRQATLKELWKWYHTPWQVISFCPPPKVTTRLALAPPGSLFPWSRTCWVVTEGCTLRLCWASTLLASPSSTLRGRAPQGAGCFPYSFGSAVSAEATLEREGVSGATSASLWVLLRISQGLTVCASQVGDAGHHSRPL